MDYQELEKRILEKLGVDAEQIPEKVSFTPGGEYTIVYCIVQALVEYDKMQNEVSNSHSKDLRSTS